MRGDPKPAKMIDQQGHQYRGRDCQSHVCSRPHPVDQCQSCINLHSSHETTNRCPPGHHGQIDLFRQRAGIDKEHGRKKESHQEKGNQGSQPRIHKRPVQLAVHGGPACLKGSTQKDKRNHPPGTQTLSLPFFFRSIFQIILLQCDRSRPFQGGSCLAPAHVRVSAMSYCPVWWRSFSLPKTRSVKTDTRKGCGKTTGQNDFF